eukprot:3669953-Alexandrium_andersonii.AAC.1
MGAVAPLVAKGSWSRFVLGLKLEISRLRAKATQATASLLSRKRKLFKSRFEGKAAVTQAFKTLKAPTAPPI